MAMGQLDFFGFYLNSYSIDRLKTLPLWRWDN